MATLTQILLDGDGTITAAIRHDAGTGSPFYTHCNDLYDSSSSDYVENDNSEITGEAWFSLSGVDADFGSLDSLTIDVDVWAETAVSNDLITLTARIFDADNDTTNPLINETGNLASQADTTRLTRFGVCFGLTGTKAQWDSAYIRFTWTYTKVSGPDNANLRLYGCDIDGTYTAASPNHAMTVPLGDLNLDSAAPLVAVSIMPPLGDLALSTTAPTVDLSIDVGSPYIQVARGPLWLRAYSPAVS